MKALSMASPLPKFSDSYLSQNSPTDHRFHLHHGPIDLVVDLRGSKDAISLAKKRAQERFATLLQELTSELAILRQPVCTGITPQGLVARRMWQATNLFAGNFITPMAAVAGAVADEILQSLCRVENLQRVIVNNGGDIALWGADGERFSIGIIDEFSLALNSDIPARVSLNANEQINGVATSGWRGRSQSLGIADAVTIFASNASVADAAATLIANEVNVQSGSVFREPASNRYPDSDLGEQLVTVEVLSLDETEIDHALCAGENFAKSLLLDSIIDAGVISLQGHYRVIGGLENRLTIPSSRYSLASLSPDDSP